MGGIASVLYGGLVYLVFLPTFLYAIAFVGNLPVPKTIDSGDAGPARRGARSSTRCCSACSPIQHSVMARPGFKRWWTRFVPPAGRAQHLRAARRAWRCCCSTGSGGRSRRSSGRCAIRPASRPLQVVFWFGWRIAARSARSSSTTSSCSACARSLPACAAARCRQPVFRTPLLYQHGAPPDLPRLPAWPSGPRR